MDIGQRSATRATTTGLPSKENRYVFVRTFPDATGLRQVSVDGGIAPRWRADGAELFYTENATLMAAPIFRSADQVELGQVQHLFDSADLVGPATAFVYDAASDGQRFIMSTLSPGLDGQPELPKIRIVQNWYEEFRDRRQ